MNRLCSIQQGIHINFSLWTPVTRARKSVPPAQGCPLQYWQRESRCAAAKSRASGELASWHSRHKSLDCMTSPTTSQIWQVASRWWQFSQTIRRLVRQLTKPPRHRASRAYRKQDHGRAAYLAFLFGVIGLMSQLQRVFEGCQTRHSPFDLRNNPAKYLT